MSWAMMMVCFFLPQFDAKPVLTVISFVVTAIIACSALGLNVGATLVSGVTNRSLLAHGQSAHATILSVWETGTVVNNRPIIRLRLNVRPPGQAVFEAEAERVLPLLRIANVQPGEVIMVKYDPRTHDVAMVD
jgi:hypothetical protein